MNYLAFLLTAEGNTATQTTSNPFAGGFIWIIMIVLMVGMFWWTSRSQKKKDKEVQDMRDSLQVGDEVTTIGGVIGKVVSIKEETFVLETSKEKTHIRFLKAAIRTIDLRVSDVIAAEAAEAAAKDQPAEPEAEAEAPKKKSWFKKNK